MNTVAVGIFVFNGMPYINEAIQSIIDQTHKVDEIVISDNASTDDTVSVVKSFIEKYPNYKWKLNLNDRNLGFRMNGQKVIDMTQSKLLLFLHADDILKNDTIDKQIKFLEAHPEVALVGGYDDSIDEKGQIINKHKNINDVIFHRGEIYRFISITNSYIPFSTVLHKVDVIRKIEFDNSLIADEIYWPKVLQYYPIAILGSALTFRRFHSGNTTHTYNMDYDRNRIEIQRHLDVAEYQPDKRDDIRNLITYKYANYSLSNFLNLFLRLKIIKALKFLALAARLHPTIFIKTNFLYQYLLRVPIKIYKVVFKAHQL